MLKYAVVPAVALLSSCAAPQLAMVDRDQQRLSAELVGRVAGRPQNCLPGFRTDDMKAVGENTIVVRDGSTIYLSRTSGSCRSSGSSSLVIRRVSSSNLCQGDIAQVVDLQNGVTHGSCSFGEFVPYRRP
ncbi:MAG: hypothetical protein M3Q83_05565 [Pseudomonadota bacterium]|nr:hypothetical protein [Pseudomonadota bacterium]